MPPPLLTLLLLIPLHCLHLTTCPVHYSTSPLHSQLQSSLQRLQSLQDTIDNQMKYLDPYNQTSRIEALEMSVKKDRD